MHPSQSSKHDHRRIMFIASEAVLAAWSARRAPTGKVIGISDADPGGLETITHRIDLRWHDLRDEAAYRWRGKGLDLPVEKCLNTHQLTPTDARQCVAIPHGASPLHAEVRLQ